jgi:riboflavin synthase
MFTGIVETLGVVKGWRRRARCAPLLEIRSAKIARGAKIGGSVSVNGACLTVTKKSDKSLFFNVIGETKARTTLGRLKAGDRVCLERPLRWPARLEGHFVQGHVDGVGQVRRVLSKRSEKSFLISYPRRLDPFFIEKGSVAVDGTSLTVGKVSSGAFWVHCIPHTLRLTNFGRYRAGSRVNLEADILLKSRRRAGKVDKPARRV